MLHRAHHPHQPLHTKVESLFGSGDLRLIYGMAAPLLLAVALIVVFALIGKGWLVAPLMLAVLALTAVIIVGLGYMLDDDSGDE